MKLTDLSPAPGSKKGRRRRGRGNGSGNGTYAGKGCKGQRSRSGYKSKPWFEGGQMPLQRRVPKRGFHNLFSHRYQLVNLGSLNGFDDGAEVTPEAMQKANLIREAESPVKILSDGELEKKLTVKAHKASAKALEKIAAAGGTFEALAK